MPTRALRWLSWFHRWTGVVLCLIFALWFASGAILIFVPFPSLSDRDRLAASERIDLTAIRTAPARALAVAGGSRSLRLIEAAGRPLYVVQPDDGPDRAIDAATGRMAPQIDAATAGAIASRFGGAAVRSVKGPLNYDQWVVHQHFDPWRPLFRVALNDPLGTQLYVSARTGEVVQRTRAGERAWNWAGAVTHWIYFTALRKSFRAWDQTVWWVSLAGLATALVGTFLGLYRTQKRLGGRRPDWSPFRGWLRWHHGLGLGAAAFVLIWIFSGWLSMDHGRLFSRGEAPLEALFVYHGAPLAQAMASVAPADFSGLGPASQIDLDVVGGRAFAVGESGSTPAQARLLDPVAARDTSQLPTALVADAAARAWPLASRTPRGPGATDDLYRKAEGMPGRAVSFPLTTPAAASIYIDPVTGRFIVLMNPSRKAYAWFYYALHTFNLPGLIDHPNLRRGLELILVTLGLGFSVTGLVIAVKRLRIATA